MNKSLRLVAALFAAVLVAGACGATESGSGSDRGPTTSTTEAAPPDEREADAPEQEPDEVPDAPDGPYSTQPIDFTTEEGWSYQFRPDFAQPTLTLTKETADSPPGKAVLRMQMEVPENGSRLVSTDEGRNAPGLNWGGFTFSTFAKANTEAFFRAKTRQGEWDFTPPEPMECELSGDFFDFTLTAMTTRPETGPGFAIQNGGSSLVCPLKPGIHEFFGESSEAAVDGLIADHELQMDMFGSAPVVYFVSGMTSNASTNCGAMFFPDGEVDVLSPLSDGLC